jgi:hypothetical protein
MIIGMAASLNSEVENIDVNKTFLHGELEEKILMEHPERFVIKAKEYCVCKFKKCLYGLEQAPR